MIHIIKIVLFLLVNLAGFYTIPVMVNVFMKLGIFPDMPTYEMLEELRHWLFDIGMLVWLGAAVASIGYFFTPEKVRVWLILAPLYVPFFFGAGVMIYFNFFAPVRG